MPRKPHDIDVSLFLRPKTAKLDAPMTTAVAIVEDHKDFRDGLNRIIKATKGLSCVGAYGSVEEAVASLGKCDVILLDIGLPGKSGVDGIRDLRKKIPQAQIIMMTVFDDDKHIFRAILNGANGYLLKKTPPQRIIASIKEAVAGGMPMTPPIARRAFELLKKYAPEPGEETVISARESEVLGLLVDGYDYKAIASTLNLSIDTVRNHIRSIYKKLQVHSKSQAVAKALKEGLV